MPGNSSVIKSRLFFAVEEEECRGEAAAAQQVATRHQDRPGEANWQAVRRYAQQEGSKKIGEDSGLSR